MKTLRMKVTHGQSALGISFFSCPDTYNDAEKTLKKVRKAAADKKIDATYEIASDLQYFAVNGARMWLLSESGDAHADQQFRGKLVNAGIITTVSDAIGIVCTREGDHRVQVITTTHCTTIDTITGDVTIDQIPKAVTELKPPVSSGCGLCGKPWDKHEFGVPAPYCPE